MMSQHRVDCIKYLYVTGEIDEARMEEMLDRALTEERPQLEGQKMIS